MKHRATRYGSELKLSQLDLEVRDAGAMHKYAPGRLPDAGVQQAWSDASTLRSSAVRLDPVHRRLVRGDRRIRRLRRVLVTMAVLALVSVALRYQPWFELPTI